jgi:tetratricopeptide (TPR) repeat protein
MGRIEKTIFISYRRTNVAWALAVFQNLTQHGFDVFFDFQGIAAGDFEKVILENIRARAHFLVLLTPSALERIDDPGDWLRREIEVAFESKRNIVPLMLEGFSFSSPAIAPRLTGALAPLRSYNALSVPPEYFLEAMGRLRDRYLNVSLDAVLHPASAAARQVVTDQQVAASAAAPVSAGELTAEEWFERGIQTTDHDEELRCFSEVIRLRPSYAQAYYSRGTARQAKRDLDGAIADYGEAIRLKLGYADAYYNRGLARKAKGDLDGAIADYGEAIRLNPRFAKAYTDRGLAQSAKGNADEALADYGEAILLDPGYAKAYYNRAIARGAKGDVSGAMEDNGEAIRLDPDYTSAYYNRAVIRASRKDNAGAIADYQKYLDLGGGLRDGDQAVVEDWIRRLRGE